MMFWLDFKYIGLSITYKCLQSYKNGQVCDIESIMSYEVCLYHVFIHNVQKGIILFDDKICIFVIVALLLTIFVLRTNIEWYYMTHLISKNVNKGIS